MRIPDYEVTSFPGLNTVIKDKKSLKPGVATTQHNWLTGKYGDHIELRRGQAVLGVRVTGAGKVTGLGVGTRYDGVQVLFKSHGQIVKYYDTTTEDWVEVINARTSAGNILGTSADGEDVVFAPYQNLAGSFVYISSPNSPYIYKVHVANPGYAVPQTTSVGKFGVLKFNQGRANAGQRNGTSAVDRDKTGLYLSDIDKALLSSYPAQTTGESVGTGDGVTRTFTDTLANISGARTAMYVAVTDSVETFADDRNGNMVGSLGGTGTVNYATGAISVTFATAPANLQAITSSYYYEDATSDGPLDFDTTSTGAGKAKIFRQDDGGGVLNAIMSFLGVNYCIHQFRTWALTISLDDTESTNLPYRNVGINYPRAAVETPDGILMVDTSNPNEPKVRRLEIKQNTDNLTIIPNPISESLDLTDRAFDYAVAFRWGDYEIVACQELVHGEANTYNAVFYARNVVSGAWDQLDYRTTCLAIYEGTLVSGDPISNNVYTLFSGFDDDEAAIDNAWEDGQLNLGTNNQKVAHLMRVTGLIQSDQDIAVYLTLDDGTPVLAFTIDGNGSYVDQGINTPIGSYTIGSKVIGGGGEATAHPFDVTFEIHTDRFQYITTGFQALGLGHAAINSYMFKDIRDKGARSLPIKTV